MTDVAFKTQQPSEIVKQCRIDVLQAIHNYKGKITPEEILATLSFTVGQVIALQDMRKMTREIALEIVASNIELGNASVVKTVQNMPTDGRA